MNTMQAIHVTIIYDIKSAGSYRYDINKGSNTEDG